MRLAYWQKTNLFLSRLLHTYILVHFTYLSAYSSSSRFVYARLYLSTLLYYISQFLFSLFPIFYLPTPKLSLSRFVYGCLYLPTLFCYISTQFLFSFLYFTHLPQTISISSLDIFFSISLHLLHSVISPSPSVSISIPSISYLPKSASQSVQHVSLSLFLSTEFNYLSISSSFYFLLIHTKPLLYRLNAYQSLFIHYI